MSDITLTGDNDLYINNGQIYLLETQEELTRQKLLNKLRSFTNTLFTNVNYGIRDSLVFERDTQSLLDQDIKSLIQNTRGIVELKEYTSEVSTGRTYTANFTYSVVTGELVNITSLVISGNIA